MFNLQSTWLKEYILYRVLDPRDTENERRLRKRCWKIGLYILTQLLCTPCWHYLVCPRSLPLSRTGLVFNWSPKSFNGPEQQRLAGPITINNSIKYWYLNYVFGENGSDWPAALQELPPCRQQSYSCFMPLNWTYCPKKNKINCFRET